MGKIVLNSFRQRSHQVRSAPSHDAAYELAIGLGSTGYEVCPDDYDWDGLKRGEHPTLLLQYTLAGAGRLRFEQQDYDISPGQLMIVAIPHDHHYWLPQGGFWEHMYFTAIGAEVIRLGQYVIERQGPVIDINPQARCIQSMSQLVNLCCDGGISNAAQASSMLYNCMLEFLQHDYQENNSDAPAIQASMDYARLHLAKDIGVTDMAQAAGLSRHHYSRLFKRIHGNSPAQWLNEQRIHQAARLLTMHQLSLADIAEQCGFNDVNYFGKVFRRLRGMSPGQYRDSGLFG